MSFLLSILISFKLIRREIAIKLTLAIITLLFLGCSRNIPSLKERTNTTKNLVDNKTIQKNINTKNFTLFSLQKIQNSCQNIKIYIEGDGLAWIIRTLISKDPTPLNPLALKLMLLDNSSCKIYLARPCQYVESKQCNKKYWTSHRFAKEVIDSYDVALDSIKKEYKNSTFSLVGYSGGAAVALLVASKREDINYITTIAGNLDPSFWTQYHHINSLTGSLNPVNYAKKLEKIPQYHLIGQNDNIMPKKVFDSYMSYFKDKKNIHYKLYDATHGKNWEEVYKNFLQRTKVGY